MSQQQNPESQENQKEQSDKVLSENEVKALTVAKLREICVLQNLGGEKLVKAELVKKVNAFMQQKR